MFFNNIIKASYDLETQKLNLPVPADAREFLEKLNAYPAYHSGPTELANLSIGLNLTKHHSRLHLYSDPFEPLSKETVVARRASGGAPYVEVPAQFELLLNPSLKYYSLSALDAFDAFDLWAYSLARSDVIIFEPLKRLVDCDSVYYSALSDALRFGDRLTDVAPEKFTEIFQNLTLSPRSH